MYSFNEDVNQFIRWLDKFINLERVCKKDMMVLDTIKYFCKKFNHPENFAPSVHITGSKGKGSVSMMIGSILAQAQYKTGLYNSPTVYEFLERVCKPNDYFTKEEYKRAIDELIPIIENTPKEEIPNQKQITWFELVTLFAFLVFRQAKVDYSVFEVGMGGLYDATNVINPSICCITPLELEHTEILGDTVEKIAEVKAGIIKNNVPVIISKQTDSVKNIFRKHAKDKNCDIYFIDEIMDDIVYSYDIENKMMNIKLECSKYFKRPIITKLKLLGEFQPYNAAIAALAIKIGFPQISEEDIEKGLEKAILPGRYEIIKDNKSYPNIPYIILDGAHTVNSVKYTMDTYNEFFKNEKNGTLIYGCFALKDCTHIAPFFKGYFSDIILTKPGEFRKSDIESMKSAFQSAGLNYDADEDYVKQIKKGFEIANSKKTPLLITGSFYLVGEAMKILKNEH